MIYKDSDGKHYFNEGKYSKIPLDHVPTEYLDWILENFLNTNNLEKLKDVQLILEYKIKRIQTAIDSAEGKTEVAKAVTQPTIRRR